MDSRCTIGAMASKKASSVSPVSCWMAADERRRRERPGGDDDAVPLGRRQAGDLAALDGDQRVLGERARDLGGEMIAIDGQRAAGRQLVGVAGRHDQRAGAAHLLVQQADGVGVDIVGAERVGADQLGQAVGLVRLGAALRAHLVQHDGHAGRAICHAASRPGEPAADDVDGCVHGRNLGANGGTLNLAPASRSYR